tara:strand:- start:901 stop:2025 length:1125 start_codon:yes stop_codon:yes gene_type:complete
LLRIFLAFPKRGSIFIRDTEIWLKHVIPSLEKLGHELVVLERDFGSLIAGSFADSNEESQERQRFTEELYDAVVTAHQEKPVDLFFSYFYSRCVDHSVLSAINDLEIPTLNFSCNNVHQFFTVEEIAPKYDYCMVPERAALEKFEAVGAHVIHVQMGANPDLFFRGNRQKEYPMIFIGSKYADRENYIATLVRAGVDVRVWGPGWQVQNARQLATKGMFAFKSGGIPRVWRGMRRLLSGWSDSQLVGRVAGPILTDDEMIATYNASSMALNFSKAIIEGTAQQYVRHIRMRDFEIPMTGAAAFLEYSAELGEYYDLETEIVSFDSPEELAAKATYYASHARELQMIAEAGYKRATTDHTWESRFKVAFDKIGLD